MACWCIVLLLIENLGLVPSLHEVPPFNPSYRVMQHLTFECTCTHMYLHTNKHNLKNFLPLFLFYVYGYFAYMYVFLPYGCNAYRSQKMVLNPLGLELTTVNLDAGKTKSSQYSIALSHLSSPIKITLKKFWEWAQRDGPNGKGTYCQA